MKMLCACAIALLVLVGAIAPAQAWTCLPFKYMSKSLPESMSNSTSKPMPKFLLSMDVDYSPETGWTVIKHVLYNNGIVEVWDYHGSVVMENIDGSQFRGVPTARHLPKLEGWSVAGTQHLGEDGAMNYTEQTYDPSSKLYDQVDLKCHKELIS